MGWRSKAEKAKKDHRPSLKDWSCDKLYKTFPTYRDSVLSKPNLGYECEIPFPNQTKKRSYHYYMSHHPSKSHSNEHEQAGIEVGERSMIPARINAKETPPSDFHSKYEATLVPTVITNIPQGFDVPLPPPPPPGHNPNHKSKSNSETNPNKDTTIHAWKALENWDLETLAKDDDLRERMFKCGEDDDGKSIKLKLKHFLRYLENNIDDSPLYVFDSSFEDDRVAKRILADYRVPSYFNEDLFHLVGERRRPPYRWFLIGPERSGTCVHIDPLATSAWNTLLAGKKRWVLFPPHVPKSVVKGSKYIYKGEDDEAIHYFTKILPRIKRAARESENNGVGTKFENFECYEFTQYENETVFIPNGWWHAVLNLTDTVGVTQNYCSQRNFDQVWLKTRTGRKKMAYKWLNKLETVYPHLATRAMELNRQDNFVMKYNPEEVERRRREEEEREKARKEKKKKKEHHRRSSSSSMSSSKKVLDRGCGDFNSLLPSTSDISCNRDAKRSRLERVVSPDVA